MLVLWELTSHHVVEDAQVEQFVHALLDVGAANQLVQLFSRVYYGAQNFHIYVCVMVLLNLPVGNERVDKRF